MTEKVLITVWVIDGGGVSFSLGGRMHSPPNRMWPSIVIAPILVTR